MHHEIIKNFSRGIRKARNPDEALDCVTTSSREAGFTHALFVAMTQHKSANGLIHPFLALSSTSHIHDKHRFARLLANSSLAKEVRDKLCPVGWLTHTLDMSGQRTDIEMRFSLESASVYHGATASVFGLTDEFSLLNFFSTSAQHDSVALPSTLALLQHLAAQFHFHVLRYLKQAPPTRRPTASAKTLLSLNEIKCLDKIAEGYTLGEIARNLGISYHTVKYYLRRATLRLGARNRSNAVAIALAMGLIGRP